MNGKVVWSNAITPGITIMVMQVNYRLGLIMIDQQLWCEAHAKECNKFSFGIVHPEPLGNGYSIEAICDPELIP